MSNFYITPEDAVKILNKALRLEENFQEGMEFDEIQILKNRFLVFKAKNALDPTFAAIYKKVASEWFPGCNL